MSTKAKTKRLPLFRSLPYLLAVTALMTGCEPTVFGVPQSQWNTLNDQQRTQVIQGYNQRQQQAVANEPWLEAIGAASSIFSNACHGGTSSSHSTSTTTSHTHALPNGWETKSKTKGSGLSFSTPC